MLAFIAFIIICFAAIDVIGWAIYLKEWFLLIGAIFLDLAAVPTAIKLFKEFN